MQTSNFEFLKEHDPLFFQLARSAENAFASDPNTTLIKLRQLGEVMAQHIATCSGIAFNQDTKQIDLLYAIQRELQLPPVIRDLFHTLRKEGNRATHQFTTSHRAALDGLKVARAIAVWFHESFGLSGADFKPAPFVEPVDPSAELQTLHTQIELLRQTLLATNQQLDASQQYTKLLQQEKMQHQALLEQMKLQAAQTTQQSQQELAQLQTKYEARLQALQEKLAQQPQQTARAQQTQLRQRISRASQSFELNEELTRILIDEQLQDAGWQADTQRLTYQNGARPERGVNKAIAEWPTHYQGKDGRADYVLFCGLTPIAAVEAKKQNLNVAGKISQAERYAKGFQLQAPMESAWQLAGLHEPWSVGGGTFYIPFVYSCNGRPYVKQLAEQSGTWFRDVRACSNLKKALFKFHSPEGLLDILKRSRKQAEEKLKQEGFAYLKLRDYQQKAIEHVEEALAENQQNCLLAMATGTGKTRTIIGLMYRFLKTERFKRILFLVDRNALGKQAIDFFNEAPLEQNQPLSKIYNIASLGDMAAEAETRIQVATVQAMVLRVFASDAPPPIDEFDCIIVDEAHRGYTLDQDMTEGELATRDAAQYLSSYRRVLDYFDAVKIGLTATPAKHTTEIFGKPVYTYSYREAVADDWLIDHEPPIRYTTLLSKNGIHFDKGSEVSVINTNTGGVELAELDDEMDFDVEHFNRRVITEDFNRVICDELAQKQLDPFGEEKTLIFCVTDRHADMVKRLLDEAFKEAYGDEYNEAAVAKITSQSDKVDTLIKQYKNERYPNIAITVDLLTTGIDVARICHLVFMRKVKSRILYEQMKGRATRRCDEIGKTVFHIYDPVDLYATLQEVSSMKPLVTDPNVTIAQLIDELTDPQKRERALNAKGDGEDASYAHTVLNQLSQKIMRILRKATALAQKNQPLQQKLDELQEQWGIEPAKLHLHLHELGVEQGSAFLAQHTRLMTQLEEVKVLAGSDQFPIISQHEDKLISREQNYGEHQKPGDYIESFNHFIRKQLSHSGALAVVINRPKDLTRKELKEVKMLLDEAGYTEAKLKTAWRTQTNQDIAASIIGYIRLAAFGEPLIPFADRVERAMQKVYAMRSWTPVQRRWLERLAKQVANEVLIDRERINEIPVFKSTTLLDKQLDDHLDDVLATLKENLWQTPPTTGQTPSTPLH